MNKTYILLGSVVFLILAALYVYMEIIMPYSQQGFSGPSDRLTPEVAWHNADESMISVDLLSTGTKVSNPFVVSGKARGNWYFEASFPLSVVDAEGKTLVTMPVQAQGEWMTTEFVPFSVTVALPENFRGPAMLTLRNDNASGLPEHDRSVSIPIFVE